MPYTVLTDRRGRIQILGACYASERTARLACREYWQADEPWRIANAARSARYWIEAEDTPGVPVGRVYRDTLEDRCLCS